jgi:hypothetical protein
MPVLIGGPAHADLVAADVVDRRGEVWGALWGAMKGEVWGTHGVELWKAYDGAEEWRATVEELTNLEAMLCGPMTKAASKRAVQEQDKLAAVYDHNLFINGAVCISSESSAGKTELKLAAVRVV